MLETEVRQLPRDETAQKAEAQRGQGTCLQITKLEVGVGEVDACLRSQSSDLEAQRCPEGLPLAYTAQAHGSTERSGAFCTGSQLKCGSTECSELA